MKSARRLIEGDDGLPAEEVGVWTREKHKFLKRYLDISRAARKKFLGDGNAGATYIDLFCSAGRARIRETGAWIDGSAVSAWKISQEGRAPFSEILVADIDQTRRKACVERLRRAGAPVRELNGSAIEAAKETIASVDEYGLHFAFLDPYNLGELDFSIIQTLLQLKRIDMLDPFQCDGSGRYRRRRARLFGQYGDRARRGKSGGPRWDLSSPGAYRGRDCRAAPCN